MCGCSPGLVALRAQFKGLEDWGIRGFEVWGSGVKAFRSLGFRGCTVGVLELRTLEVEGLLLGVLRTRLQGVRTAYIFATEYSRPHHQSQAPEETWL